MIAPMVRGIVPIIVGLVLVQGTLAALLVAHGAVEMPLVLPRDAFTALAGVVCGALLHSALPTKSAAAVHPPSRVALVQLSLLLVSVAIAEEVIWRGFVFASVRSSSDALVAFITTTVGFAAMHTFAQGWSGFRNHIVTGAVFGLIFWASGSLISAIAVHVSYNFMFVFGLRPQRQRAL